MPLYNIQGPGGRTYEIEGPEGATREQIISAIQARMQNEQDSSIDTWIEQQAELRDRMSSREESGFIKDATSGFGAGVVNTVEQAALGTAALAEEESELAAREKIQAAADYLRPERGDKDSYTYNIAAGVGSMAAALGAAGAVGLAATPLGAGASGIAALLGAGAVGIGAGAGEASERARAAGATEEERNLATLRGSAIGSLDMLPLGRILKLPGATKLMGKIGGKAVAEGGSRIRSALATGGVEAAQETTAAVLQNWNEQGYNAEKELFDAGLIDEAIVGGSAGAIVQAVADFFIKGRSVEVINPRFNQPRAPRISPETGLPETATEAYARERVEARQAEAEYREFEAEARQVEAEARQVEAEARQVEAEVAQPDMFPLELEEAPQAQSISDLVASAQLEAEAEARERQALVEARQPDMLPHRSPSTRYVIPKYPQRGSIPDPVAVLRAQLEAEAETEARQAEVKARQADMFQAVEVSARGREASALENEAYDAFARGDDVTFEQAVAESAQPDMFTRELEEARGANPEAALRAQLEARGERVPQRGSITDAPTAPIQEDMVDRLYKMELDDAEIAEMAATDQLAEKAGEELLALRAVSNLESTEGRRDDKREQKRAEGRLKSLQETIESTPPISYDTLPGLAVAEIAKNFEGRLKKSGVQSAEASKEELASIRRAVDFQQAEPPKPEPEPEPESESGDEAGQPDLFQAVDFTTQDSFPEMGIKGRGKTSPVAEAPPTPKTVTKEFLDGLGIPPTAPIRKRTINRDFNDPEVRNEFVTFANKDNIPEQTQLNVVKALGGGGPDAQLPLFPPRSKEVRAAATRATKKAAPARRDAQRIAQDKGVKELREKKAAVAKAETNRKAAVERNQGEQARRAAGKAATQEQRVLSSDAEKVIQTARNRGPKTSKAVPAKRPLKALVAAEDRIAAEVLVIPYSEKTVEAITSQKSPLEIKLERDAVVALYVPLNPRVIELLGTGDLKGALQALSATTANRHIAQVSNKLANVVGGTKIEIVKDLETAGSFDPTTNTIKLNSEIGMNPHVLVHEMVHAAGSATLAKPSHPMTKQVVKLFEDVKPYLDTAYGAKNVDEFFSEGQANSKFRTKLAKINPEGGTNALQRFSNILGNFLRRLVGMQPKKLETAQTTLDDFVDRILAPAPESRNANILPMNSTAKGVKKVMKEVGDTQKALRNQKPISRKAFGDAASNFMGSVGEKQAWILPKLLNLQGLSDVARSVDEGLGALAFKFHQTFELMRGDMEWSADKVKEQIKIVDRWRNKAKSEGQEHLDALIYSSQYGATIYQVDPNKPQSDYKGKTDESGNDLEAVWKAQRRDWNALGDGGQGAFNTMRSMYRAQFKMLKEVIYERIDRLLEGNPDAAEKLKKNVFEKLFEGKVMEVYFPLMRNGRYKIEYSFKEAKDGRDIYVFQMFNNRQERDQLAKELTGDPEILENSVITRDGDFNNNNFNNAPSTSFVGNVIEILDANAPKGDGKASYDVSKAEIVNLFINTLPESSFAKSIQRRKNTPGYETDSIYAMKTKGLDLARQIEKLKYTAVIQQLEVDLAKVKKKFNEKSFEEPNKFASENYKFNELVANLETRIRFAKYGAEGKEVEQYVRLVNQTAFIYTLGGNVASAAVQLFQLPCFTYPMLGGDYGFEKTRIEMGKASSIVTGARKNAETIKEATGLVGKTRAAGARVAIAHGLESYYDITDNRDFTVKKDLEVSDERRKELERIAPLVKLMHARGHLSRSFLFDQLGLAEGGRARQWGRDQSLGKNITSALDFATGASAVLFNQADRYNRQITALTAYNLALDRITTQNPSMPLGERQDKAAHKALYDMDEYNGGSTLETAPTVLQQGLGRVAGMYKSYGLGMYKTMIKTAIELKDIFVEAKKAEGFSAAAAEALGSTAMKQMLAIHGSALFFSGVHGLPLYGAVQMVADLLLDLSDEEDDFNTIVRNYIDEGWYKGWFNQALEGVGAGADVSTRIRMTGLLIQENRFNTDPTPEEFLGLYLGGPAFSTAKKIYRGINELRDGNFERGAEQLVPAAFSNAYKGLVRYQRDDGIYTRRHDPMYDDITGGELAGQFFGFAPSNYIRQQEENQRLRGISNSITDARTKLTRKYYYAFRTNDSEELTKTQRAIDKFNRKYPAAAISAKTIKASIKQHEKTTARMYNGITLSPYMLKIMTDNTEQAHGFLPALQ